MWKEKGLWDLGEVMRKKLYTYIICIFIYYSVIFCIYGDSIKSFTEYCLDSKRELHLPDAKVLCQSYLKPKYLKLSVKPVLENVIETNFRKCQFHTITSLMQTY